MNSKVNENGAMYFYYRDRSQDGNVSPHGGAVVAYAERDGRMFAAAAYCNPSDNFCYQYGRAKSNGRLTQVLNDESLADGNTYFAQAATDDTHLDFLNRVYNFMVNDLGYIHRGQAKQKAQETKSA